jgi:hypothetical protein
MVPLQLKLPADVALRIKVLANQMGTTKSALTRALVLKKFAELESQKSPPAHPNPKPSDSVRVRGSDQCENLLSAEKSQLNH